MVTEEAAVEIVCPGLGHHRDGSATRHSLLGIEVVGGDVDLRNAFYWRDVDRGIAAIFGAVTGGDDGNLLHPIGAHLVSLRPHASTIVIETAVHAGHVVNATRAISRVIGERCGDVRDAQIRRHRDTRHQHQQVRHNATVQRQVLRLRRVDHVANLRVFRIHLLGGGAHRDGFGDGPQLQVDVDARDRVDRDIDSLLQVGAKPSHLDAQVVPALEHVWD